MNFSVASTADECTFRGFFYEFSCASGEDCVGVDEESFFIAVVKVDAFSVF